MRRITIACWASFWPKKATSGATELSSFATTVVTPRKWPAPRRSGAIEHLGSPPPTSTLVAKPSGYTSSTGGA